MDVKTTLWHIDFVEKCSGKIEVNREKIQGGVCVWIFCDLGFVIALIWQPQDKWTRNMDIEV